MFMQDDMYSGYMDKFFAIHPKGTISWIHDLEKQRYKDASMSLLSESKTTPDLETKHVSDILL
jgi:nuclear pore complex protein Nup133